MIDNAITDVEKAVTRPCQLIYSFWKKKSPGVWRTTSLPKLSCLLARAVAAACETCAT